MTPRAAPEVVEPRAARRARAARAPREAPAPRRQRPAAPHPAAAAAARRRPAGRGRAAAAPAAVDPERPPAERRGRAALRVATARASSWMASWTTTSPPSPPGILPAYPWQKA